MTSLPSLSYPQPRFGTLASARQPHFSGNSDDHSNQFSLPTSDQLPPPYVSDVSSSSKAEEQPEKQRDSYEKPASPSSEATDQSRQQGRKNNFLPPFLKGFSSLKKRDSSAEKGIANLSKMEAQVREGRQQELKKALNAKLDTKIWSDDETILRAVDFMSRLVKIPGFTTVADLISPLPSEVKSPKNQAYLEEIFDDVFIKSQPPFLQAETRRGWMPSTRYRLTQHGYNSIKKHPGVKLPSGTHFYGDNNFYGDNSRYNAKDRTLPGKGTLGWSYIGKYFTSGE
jgi:hypothetical protein